MKINLYKCDICNTEHRRSNVIGIHIVKGTMTSADDMYDHLCSICEEKIREVINFPNLEVKK